MYNKIEVEINAQKFNNYINLYIDGVKRDMILVENKLIMEQNFEKGEHTIKIERSSTLTEKYCYIKYYKALLKSFYKKLPYEFGKGKIYNAVFEGKFNIESDTKLWFNLTENKAKPIDYDSDKIIENKNIFFEDMTLTKKRTEAKEIVVGFFSLIFWIIVGFILKSILL